MCFYNRDGLEKEVSFDFIESSDPIKSTFTEERKQKTHEMLYHAYNSMNRVYRDQHFLLERKIVHSQIMASAENKLVQMTFIKAIIIAVACVLQFYAIKKIVDGDFSFFTKG